MTDMASRQKTLSLILKESVDLMNSAASGKRCCEMTKEFNIWKTQGNDILKRKAENVNENISDKTDIF